LYQILRKVNQPKIIFLGDISQLAPIGKGMPFKDILHMLPCCTLNVGKRCLESSYIAENNDIIINSIDTPLAIGQDFQTLVCSEEEMQQTVLNSVKGLLGITGQQPVGTRLYKATEVQVISPVVKPNYIWGTYQLNRALQPVFTPKPKFKFKYDTQEGIEYREGDRVLHKENNNKFLHYQRIDEHTFQKTCEYGLVNGDIGYIRSVIKADQLKLLEVAEGDKADYEEIAETIRDDSLYITDKEAYFVAIEYDGFYALYLAYEDTEENVVKSKDMKALDLAYALTVHKLQGSSAACIVFVIGKIPYNNTFINRNLIYTGVSRARESELLIGDVSNGRNSTLSKGRRIKQQENVETVMSLLYREG
jgi:exodeoxyribonuclease V alpha subunit